MSGIGSLLPRTKIARLWRGWTAPRVADAYVEYLERTGIPEYRGTPGNLGAFILRRSDGDRVEFVTLSFWESLESVAAFAGENVDEAVFYPEDDRFLVDRETTVTHFELFDAAPDGESAVRELRVALTVDDFEQAVAFYRDGLGLPVVASWERESDEGAILSGGRGTLELLSRDAAALVDDIEVGRRIAGPMRLAFDVPDAGATAERLAEAGATLLSEQPVVTPWSDRNVRLLAPEGVQLTLFTVADEAD